MTGEPIAGAVGGRPFFFLGAYHAVRRDGARPLSPLGLVLQSFKDRGDRFAGRCLADLFAHALAPHAGAARAIVPVPADSVRLRDRGYSPAAWLARALSRRSGIPVLAEALRRRAGHPPQRGLGGEARRRNAHEAFALGRGPVAGYTLILVDDVVTTGATLLAASGLLSRGGATSVTCMVAACADQETIAKCRSRTVPAGNNAICARRR